MKRLPLFSEKNEKKTVKKLCHSIGEQLSAYYSTENKPGILNGLAGISLYFFHLSRVIGEKDYTKHGYHCLEKIIQAINEGFQNPAFSSGLAGVNWAFKYLGEMNFISQKEALALSGLESVYNSYAKECFIEGNYDFLHGALGMAMTDLNRELVDIIVMELGSLSKADSNNSLYWESRDIYGKNEINLGLSHGIPSIILILSNIYRQHPDPRIMDNQIIPGMNFLISQMSANQDAGSLFPSRITGGVAKRPSRMAWCYGDPGVATAIYQIGANCSRPDWQKLANKILLHGTKRRSCEQTKIEDSCICHGSSGLALIYYNAFINDGLQEFYDASRYWSQETIKYAGKDGEFLFKGLECFEPSYNLLEGITGVGLCLLAMMEDETPGWVKSLLMR